MAAVLNTDVKQKILISAEKLLHDTAFDAITLGNIAKNAGISKGTLYYYYSSKDDIVFDIADEYLKDLAKSLLEWANNKNKDTSLPRFFRYIFKRGVFNESGNLRLYLIGAAVSGHEALRERLSQKYNYFKSTIAQKLTERGTADAEYYAWLALAVMDGMLIQNRLGNNEFPTEMFIDSTVNLLDSQCEGGNITNE